VFHAVLHPAKNGSGVPTQSQHQRLEADGCQLQIGHRIPLKASLSSSPATSNVIWPGARSSFKKYSAFP
jgi:hypothetical protein